MKKIFIDVGHGGSDPGASAYGVREKDICLEISLLLRDILNEQYIGHLVKLSRTTDQTLSLSKRTNMANKWGAHLLLSIHVNAGRGTGFESFTYSGSYPNKSTTNRFQNIIHQAIVKEITLRDRGRKEANFHMLRESSMSALLTENGFIDHLGDVNQLKTAAYLRRIATGHANGLAQAFGLKKKGNNKVENQLFHIIKPGDTLWSLARKHHTTVEKLEELNRKIDPYRLQIGRRIQIKG